MERNLKFMSILFYELPDTATFQTPSGRLLVCVFLLEISVNKMLSVVFVIYNSCNVYNSFDFVLQLKRAIRKGCQKVWALGYLINNIFLQDTS